MARCGRRSRFIEQDRTADAIAEVWSGNDQITVVTADFGGLRDVEQRKPQIAGSVAFVHREQPFAVCEEFLCRIDQQHGVHTELFHFQFRISVIS